MDKRTNKRAPKKKVKKKKSGLKKFFLMLFSLLLIGVVTFAGYSYYSLYKMGKNTGEDKEGKNVKTVEVEKNDPVNILIVGVDIGDPKAKDASDPKRTDTMMIMHYEPKQKKADIVSIPRDTMVEIDGKTQKINAAHAIGGMKYAINSVEELMDISINYYVKLDYEGFRQVIDAIGGVDMPINYNMNYDDPGQNLSIHFKKGTLEHLDGKKAEEFFRWRKNNNGTGLAEGDLGRIKNQHLFIEKVVEKVKSPSIVFKLKDILDIIPKYVKTNMIPKDIIAYGMAISGLDKSNIKMDTLEGEGKYVNGVSYFVYDEDKGRELLNSIRGVKPMSVDRSSLRIKVLNGTKKSGLASNYAEYLKKKGYSNIETGNGEKIESTRMILNKQFDGDAVSNIKREFNIRNIESSRKSQNTDNSYDIIVTLGADQEYIK